MTSDQLKTLVSEIESDPANLGYASKAKVGDDDGIAALLNTATATVPVATLSKNAFLKSTAGIAVRLALGVGADGQPLDVVTVTKWRALLAHAYAADPGSQIELSIMSAMGDPVKERLGTAEELAAMTTTQGTRAQLLFGQSINHLDVARALRP